MLIEMTDTGQESRVRKLAARRGFAQRRPLPSSFKNPLSIGHAEGE